MTGVSDEMSIEVDAVQARAGAVGDVAAAEDDAVGGRGVVQDAAGAAARHEPRRALHWAAARESRGSGSAPGEHGLDLGRKQRRIVRLRPDDVRPGATSAKR